MTQLVEKPGVVQTRPSSVGPAKAASNVEEGSRLAVFLHALAFVAGFTVVFTLLGSAMGLMGRSLNFYLPAVQRIGAILLVLFGLVTLGVFRWLANTLSRNANLATNPAAAALVSVLEFFNSLLYTERRVTEMHNVNRSWGYLSSVMLGVSFSAGWTPCIGPILSGILFLAGDSGTVTQGALLLAIYSVGLGIPFLITGAAFSRATTLLRRLNRHMGVVSIISGLFLLFVAYLLWSNNLGTLAGRFSFLSDKAYFLEEWVTVNSGTNGDVMGMSVLNAAPLALLAGLISFISPCVLPLVPAYIGYLSGAAVGGKRRV